MDISRKNNFDLIRLMAALQVFYGHALKHLDVPVQSWAWAKVNWLIGCFHGVPIFFVISGFLIAKSWESNRDDGRQYFVNRFLRIYPALWLGLGLTLTCMIVSGSIDGTVLSSNGFWTWLVGQVTFFQFFTPDCLRSYGVGTPNGSLWTIPVELQFYLLVPLIAWAAGRFRGRLGGNVFIGACAVFSFVLYALFIDQKETASEMKLFFMTFVPQIWMFLFGMLLYRNYDVLQRMVNGKALFWFGLYLIMAIVESSVGKWAPLEFVSGAVMAFFVVSAAFTCSGVTSLLLRGQDLSYGMYVYHMIIINLFVHIGFGGTVVSMAAAFACVLAASAVSWNMLEKKVLAYKEMLSSRHEPRRSMICDMAAADVDAPRATGDGGIRDETSVAIA